MDKKIRLGRKILFVISEVFNFKMIYLLKIAKNRILTEGIKRELKYCGTDFWIEGPVELRGAQYISIGNDFACRSGLRIDAIDKYNDEQYSPHIQIGNGVRINNYCHLGAINQLTIEDNVVIASKVYISDHSHGEITKESVEILVKNRALYSKGKVHICENVWIGESVSILPGVTIGKNSIVGANSVVTKDVPENSVVAGIPATILRKL